MLKHLEKFHVIHLWLGQHEAMTQILSGATHTLSRPTHWAVCHGGLGRPGSAGVVCCPPPILKK